MYRVAVTVPGEPSQAVLERLLEALTQANAEWYLEEWAAGRKPPCCASCGGVRYVPDQRGFGGIELVPAPEVFRRKEASCGPAAAIAAGEGRAKALQAGYPLESAMMHRVALEPQGNGYWHAVYMSPYGRKDPTTKMQSGASTITQQYVKQGRNR